MKKLHNLQIGDNDLVGNKFNGHDLHNYLNERGINSKHLVWNKESKDGSTFEIDRDNPSRMVDMTYIDYLQKKYKLDNALSYIGYSILYDRLFLESDVIHLHLIHNLNFDIQILPLMSKLKPIVWTLHDVWAFTGASQAEDSLESDCYNSFLKAVSPHAVGNEALNYSIKGQAIINSQVDIIVASEWMKTIANKSELFKGKRIYKIPFGINQRVFFPKDKQLVKRKLNIPEESIVILFRNDHSGFKGMDYIEYVLSSLRTKLPVYFIAVGDQNNKLESKYPLITYPWIKDDSLLSDVYNASDIILMPSKVDAFGMMAAEAMCCKTLPIVLDGTALPETVNSPECGVMVRKDKKEYLETVEHYIECEGERVERSIKCYKFASKKYNLDKYLTSIIKVYEGAIKNFTTKTESKVIISQLNEISKLNTNIDSKGNKLASELLKYKSNNSFDTSKLKKLLNKILMLLPSYRKLKWTVDELQNQTYRQIEHYNLLTVLNKNIDELNARLNYARTESYKEKFNIVNKIDTNIYGEQLVLPEKHKTSTKTYEVSPESFIEEVKHYIIKTSVVIDVGSGVNPQRFFEPKVHICVEPFKQYRDVIKPLFPNNSYSLFLKADALRALKDFDDCSVDTIFMIDIIEHLNKEEGLQLIKEADRVARRQIIIFTPFGFYPQDYKNINQKDEWGLDGSTMQIHKSGWSQKDFDNSWDFFINKKHHLAFFEKEQIEGKKYDALFAIKTKKFNGFPILDITPEFVKKAYINSKTNL